MFETFRQDLSYAFRQLVKNPGFTAVTVLILALGIGANTAIFSMVNGVLLRPIPFEGGDRLVLLQQQVPASGAGNLRFSPPEVRDYRTQSQTLEEVVEYHSMWFTLLGGDEPQRVQTGVVSANFFDALGAKPLYGRSFLPTDEEDGAEPVLVLSHAFWQQEFGGDPEIVGQTFEMNDKIHTVVGVLPPIPPYPDDNHVFMPVSACPFRSREQVDTNRAARMVRVFGRLKPGATLAQAETDVGLVGQRLMSEYPESFNGGDELDATVLPLDEQLIGSARTKLLVLFGTVALVLLITCANLANLSFARLVRRERELAVRTALGAGRGRLMRLLWTESTLLAFLGGALGILLAAAMLDLLVDYASAFTSRAGEIHIDGAVLLFALGISLVTGLAIGSLSALSLRRDFFGALREGGSRSTSRAAIKHLRSGLLVAELAVSFILLIGAGLMVRSFTKLQGVDSGFDSDNVLTLQMSLNWTKYGDARDRWNFFSQVLERVNAQPGIVASAVSASFPLDQQEAANSALRFEGEDQGEAATPRADILVASPGYFDTIGVSFLSGRDFQATDDGQAPVAIVNRAMARRYFEDEDPLHKRLSIDGGQSWSTIVGIVGNARYSLESEAAAEVYLPYTQRPFLQMNLLARSAGDPMLLVKPIREMVRSIDPQQPISRIQSLDQARQGSMASSRLTTVLLSLFAAVALVIATAGLAGVVAYSVNQKTQEIGVRMALGADRGAVLWSVMREVMLLMLIGLAGGAVLAWFLSKYMSSLLYAIEPTDLVTFLAVALILAAVVGLACLVPARRATLINPVTALRAE